MLDIRLLGVLCVTRDGVALTLPPSRKTRALLAYLALEPGPHRRERLCTLFWDLPEDPRGSLRWSLSKLRPLLDEPGNPRLQASREQVQLALEEGSVDVLRARSLLARDPEALDLEALRREAGDEDGICLEGLDLPDCADWQAWCVAARDEARRDRARLLRLLAHRLRGEPEQALPYARRLARLEPQDAGSWVTLVAMLLACGHLREAEEQYRLGSRVLDDLREDGAAALRFAWRDLRERGAEAVSTSPLPPETDRVLARPAVAVLPFENLSDDPEQEYFADGITEDVITGLSRWRWFPVIARNSSFALKGQAGDVIAVGEQLGARYVVQGSVRRAGERLRVSAQLVDATTGHHVWAERFDSEIGDVFELQDSITARIVAQVAPELERAESQRVERAAPHRVQAWELNLRALGRVFRARREDFEQALALLDQSLAMDADYSDTHAIRAFCLWHRELLGWAWTENPKRAADAFLEEAQIAVGLDAANWLAAALLGISLLWSRLDYEAAEAEERRAIDLNPSGALAHQFLGCVLTYAGRPDAAVPYLNAALRLNPHRESATLLLSDLALCDILLGEFEQAVEHARRSLREFRQNPRASERLACALGHLGRGEEAGRALAEARRGPGRMAPGYLERTYPFRVQRHRELLMDGLARAGWRAEGG